MTGLSRSAVTSAPYVCDESEAPSITHCNIFDLLRVVLGALRGEGDNHLSPWRWSIGFGGLARSPFVVGAAMAALLALGACSSVSSGDSTTTTSFPLDSSPTSTEGSVTTSSSTPTITSTTSVVSSTTSPTQDVFDAWASYWEAWTEVRASDDLDPDPLDAVASPDVVDGVVALFERQRSSGLGPVQTEVALNAVVTSVDAGLATIEDCVLLSPSFTDAAGVWYEAELTFDDSDWVVDVIRIPRAGGCVPRTMADAAIDGYKAFYDGWAEFWDPAHPESALIDQVLADPQRTVIVDLLLDHESRRAALRGEPTTFPEVIEVRSSTQVVILSCLEPSADYGLYDIDTGERLDDVPLVRDGQRNLESAVMVLEDGLWKISDLQGQVDFACEFAPTERGLPSV